MLDVETKVQILYYSMLFIKFWSFGILLVICYQIANFIMRAIHNVWPTEVTVQQVWSVIMGALLSWITIILLIIYAKKSSK